MKHAILNITSTHLSGILKWLTYPQRKLFLSYLLKFITVEKSVHYVNLKNNGDFDIQSFPVKEFIFIQYDQIVDFELKKLDPITGVKLLLEQAWGATTQWTHEILFDCLTKWSYFQLNYLINAKAMDAITKLFEHD